MKQLTKKQRREIYLKVAETISGQGKDWFGLCPHLANELGCEQSEESYHKLLTVMPEFSLFVPDEKEFCALWWWYTNDTDNINVRVICMLLCAEMCK